MNNQNSYTASRLAALRAVRQPGKTVTLDTQNSDHRAHIAYMYGGEKYANENLPEHCDLLKKTYAAHERGEGLDYKTLNQITGPTTDFVDAVGIEFVDYNVSSKSLRVRAVTSLVNNALIDQHLEIFTKAGEAVAGNVSSTPNTTHADILIETDFDPADFSSSELEISYTVIWIEADGGIFKSQIHSLDTTEYIFTESPVDRIEVLDPVNVHTPENSPIVICYGRAPKNNEIVDYVREERIDFGKQKLYIPWRGKVFFKADSTAEFSTIDISTFMLQIDCGHGSAKYTVDGRVDKIIKRFAPLPASEGRGFAYALDEDWLDSVPTHSGLKGLADIVDVAFAVDYIMTNGAKGTIQISSYLDKSDAPDLKKIPALCLWWGCLAEGTLILMADGREKRIEDVRIGDEVITDYSGRTARVSNTWKGAGKEIIRIIAGDATLECSDSHPVRTVKGMKRAYKVSRDDLLVGRHGEFVEITSVERVEKQCRVYSIDLDASGTLFANGFMVGDNGVQNSRFDEEMPAAAPIFDADKKQALYADYKRFACGE